MYISTRTCKFCGGDTLAYMNNGSQCQSCFSVLVDNPPSLPELAIYYDSFQDDYHGGGRESDAQARQLKWAMKYLALSKRYGRGNTLLDVGSANNPFPNIASEFFKMTSLELKKPKSLSEKVQFQQGSITDDLIELKQFDVVTCWAVLEHVLDVEKAIGNLLSLCKPGGIIIFSTPLAGSIADKYGAGVTPWFFPPEHIYLISNNALKLMFERHGGNLVKLTTLDYAFYRRAARSLLVVLEGSIGYLISKLLPSKWKILRKSRCIKNYAVTLGIFEKSL